MLPSGSGSGSWHGKGAVPTPADLSAERHLLCIETQCRPWKPAGDGLRRSSPYNRMSRRAKKDDGEGRGRDNSSQRNSIFTCSSYIFPTGWQKDGQVTPTHIPVVSFITGRGNLPLENMNLLLKKIINNNILEETLCLYRTWKKLDLWSGGRHYLSSKVVCDTNFLEKNLEQRLWVPWCSKMYGNMRHRWGELSVNILYIHTFIIHLLQRILSSMWVENFVCFV